MNILLLDDHDLFRNGMIRMLADFSADLAFIEADTVEAALAHPGPVDLVLLDMHLRKGLQGTDALAAIRNQLPLTTVVVVSGDEDPALIRRCIELGACGFIPKTSTHAVLETALKLVCAGGVYLPPLVLMESDGSSIAAAAEANDAPASAAGYPRSDGDVEALTGLTSRQLEVLRLAMRGKQNKEIARAMRLSEGTVKTHLNSIYRALHVTNRTQALYRVVELGIRFDEPAVAKVS